MKTLVILITTLLVNYRQDDTGACTTVAANTGEANLSVKYHERDFSSEPRYNSSFYQQCVTAEVTNKGTKEATFSIPAGTFLMPDDPHLQRLMVTKSEYVPVAGKSKTNIQLYAMCTQASHGGPRPTTVFKASQNPNPSWIQLAELIEKNNYQNYAGQAAVWALSDNRPQSDIYDADTNTTFLLRSFIAQARHESYMPYATKRTYDRQWFSPVTIKYKYSMYGAHRITMRLYTFDSRVFESLSENVLTPAGTHQFERTMVAPIDSHHGTAGLKLIRWMDDVIVDVHYFKADSTAGN